LIKQVVVFIAIGVDAEQKEVTPMVENFPILLSRKMWRVWLEHSSHTGWLDRKSILLRVNINKLHLHIFKKNSAPLHESPIIILIGAIIFFIVVALATPLATLLLPRKTFTTDLLIFTTSVCHHWVAGSQNMFIVWGSMFANNIVKFDSSDATMYSSLV